MSSTVLLKLVAIFIVIAVGWVAGRTRVLGPDAAGVLNRAAFNIFAPALLFHTTAGIAVAHLPWLSLAAYFLPTVAVLLATYAWFRWREPPGLAAGASGSGLAAGASESGLAAGASGSGLAAGGSGSGAAPVVRGLALSFSNTVQLGIPVMTALFGAPGLTVLISIVSLQALILLTTGTVLAESDLARRDRARSTVPAGRLASSPDEAPRPWRRVVLDTVRRSLIHPVTLPILLGLTYNATGLPVPAPVDDVLAILGAAVVPVSLVTIGLTLQLYGMAGNVRPALALAAGKLVLLPAVVYLVAYVLFGLTGLPLVVSVLCAALPIGANVLLFAGRYDTLMGETTAAIVASTVGFAVTGTMWLVILSPHIPT